MAAFFQPNFFQPNFFQNEARGDVIDLDVLQLPVNCVMAGNQPFKDRYREWTVCPPNRRTRANAKRSEVCRLKGDKPSFTVKTGKRGYD